METLTSDEMRQIEGGDWSDIGQAVFYVAASLLGCFI